MRFFHFKQVGRRPSGIAVLKGSDFYPDLTGTVWFYQTDRGVLVVTEVDGLPQEHTPCAAPFFGFHIHGGNACSGNEQDPFFDAGSHFNPLDCPHPHHAGDMPPLLGNAGYALSVFLTDRFTIDEIIGKTVIIHDSPDDFTTQPAGNAGKKIACGVVTSNK